MLTARYLLLALALPCIARAQARHEILTGHITSDSGRAIAGATVIATNTVDFSSKTATSGTKGEYTIDWPRGSGDYALAVSAPRFQSKSFHAVRTGADSVIVADIRLSSTPVQLGAVVSQAKRPVPDRDPASYGAGGTEATTAPQNAARRLPPDQAGDLAAIAAMLPGVASVAGGISVYGLGASQNSITMNGLAFSGADVPRDAATRVRVIASTYDPSNGWFSGAQTAVDLNIGGQFTSRTTHWTVDAPTFQYTDPISARSGQRYTNLNLGLGGNGQLVDDRWAYNYGLQGGRKQSDVSTLLDAGDDLLLHAGVAPDSASRLVTLLGSAGIPTSLRGLPSGTTDDNVSFIGRIDHAPYDWTKLQYNPTTYGLQGYGKWSRSAAQGFSPIQTPAHSGTSSQLIGSGTAFFTTLFGQDYLADFRSGLTVTDNVADPYLSLPDGRALVTSSLPGGSNGISTLQFGGNSGLNARSSSWRWETNGQVQLYPPGALKHRVKLAMDARYDQSSQDLLSNTLGTFSYNSLADLAANTPASFTRTLTSPTRHSGEWNAFASVGDLYRANEKLQLIYGARIDGNLFTATPAANPAVATAFGLHTDRGPNSVDVSPRLGFTWQDGHGKILRGGVGSFRNIIDPAFLSGPSIATGLTGGVTHLTCIGAAVPTPDWRAWAADPSTIPTQCVGGPSSFVDAAPNVQTVSAGFLPQKSWRSNLGGQTSVKNNVVSVDGVLSLNVDQPGTFDHNFIAGNGFVLPAEGRTVFVPRSSIVPATGAVSPTAARPSSTFGRVVAATSDLRSLSQAAVFTLRPYVPIGMRPYFGDVSLAYTLTHVRADMRGFDAPTFDDPTQAQWARGDLDARHMIVGQMVLRPMGDARAILFIYGRLQSGLPYTPMVGSDINGDGLANDRAFVFNPAATTDTSLANGLNRLLATSPAASACLASQLGKAAGRNSCEGPWTAQLNASLRLSGQQLLHTPRMDVTINLANPLGGLDALLHGSNLRGWGAPANPDRTLYTVRGFDQANDRFLYAVNQRFGSTSPSSTTLRAPFRLTLDVSVDIGRTIPDQMLDRWLRPGRAGRPGSKITSTDLFRRFQRTVPDPYAELLQQSDSLLLSNDEVQQIQTVDRAYRTKVDAIWHDMSDYLANLGDSYDFSAATGRVDQTTDDVWEVTRLDVQKELGRILAPAQQVMLGGWAGQLFRSRDRVHIRLSPRGG